MKKVITAFLFIALLTNLSAQDEPSSKEKKKKIDLSGRPNDHLLIQLGYAGWNGKPDSVRTKGLSRSFNAYFLFDFPFKSNPKISVAVGAGIGSEHIFFDKTYVGIKEKTPTLRFINQADTTHFKKTKLATAWLEAPVELRYNTDPLNNSKSLKMALGVKVGTLLNAHTRMVELRNKNDQVINDYKAKEASKNFFNTNRLVLTARAGYGHFSVFYSYQVSELFKAGTAAEIRPYSIGLTISGL